MNPATNKIRYLCHKFCEQRKVAPCGGCFWDYPCVHLCHECPYIIEIIVIIGHHSEMVEIKTPYGVLVRVQGMDCKVGARCWMYPWCSGDEVES